MTTWQPISTAPSEQTLLVWTRHVVLGWQFDGRFVDYEFELISPTHWMPLPPAPEAPTPAGGAGPGQAPSAATPNVKVPGRTLS